MVPLTDAPLAKSNVSALAPSCQILEAREGHARDGAGICAGEVPRATGRGADERVGSLGPRRQLWMPLKPPVPVAVLVARLTVTGDV